ncbi:MAG: CBS domain-containing protein [Streptosporangiaceae bacterium]
MSEQIREFFARAAAAPVNLTIRELLAVWGFKARTFESVDRINSSLSAAGLECRPDLGDGGLDTLVRVSVRGLEAEATGVGDAAEEDEPLQLPQVAPRIGSIPSARAGVIPVGPDQSLGYARSLMIEHDYSQLPVMASERDLRGFVSWRTIAQAQLANPKISLADATNPHPYVVGVDDSLLDQVRDIYEGDFVFVKAHDDRICGIVTTADLGFQFRDLTMPFFQVGEIESRLRVCINRVFGPEELRQVTGRQELKSADDMMFGQYVQLLKDEARWRRMRWEGIDHTRFIDSLDSTRKIRNKIMHFGEELSDTDKQRLMRCLNYMRTMLPLRLPRPSSWGLANRPVIPSTVQGRSTS